MSSEDSITSALRDVKIIRNAHIPFIVIGNKVDLTPDQKSEDSELNSETVEKIETLTSPNFIQCSAKEENVEIRKAFSHLYYQGTRYIWSFFYEMAELIPQNSKFFDFSDFLGIKSEISDCGTNCEPPIWYRLYPR